MMNDIARATSPPLSLWERIVQCRLAPWLTHFSLAALLGAELVLLIELPFWAAVLPAVFTHHRIGIMLHEYMHGIPLRKYSQNLTVFSLVNGMLITFGFMEVFRGNHLAHHRWLNTERDPGWHRMAPSNGSSHGVFYRLVSGDHGLLMYFRNMASVIRRKHPYVRRNRVFAEIVLSSIWVGLWIAAGHAALIWQFAVLHIWVAHSAALRGAVEHTNVPSADGFANEYLVKLPLFNMNRHIHHHIDSTCPWYRLHFVTASPLSNVHYWTHWYHIFLKRDYAFMKPMAPSEYPSQRKNRVEELPAPYLVLTCSQLAAEVRGRATGPRRLLACLRRPPLRRLEFGKRRHQRDSTGSPGQARQ
jgi:fatty acid desaturase